MFGKKIAYFFFRSFVGFMQIVPFWLMYRLADGLYFLMNYVVRYRKSVIDKNLFRCFPEKTDKERKHIRKKFYKRLSDILIESIKGYTLSEKELLKRFTSKGHEATYPNFEENKSIFVLTGHLCNWEWGNAVISQNLKHVPAVLYKPISNPFIEKYVEARRGRFGSKMVSIYHSMRYFLVKKEKPAAYFLVADQFPTTREKQKMVDFFGKTSAFLHGPENFSKQLKAPVYFIEMKRVKRGYYAMEFFKLADDSSQLPENELTQRYAAHLEATVRRQPEDWMWSHKRWKNELYDFE
ncbi:MAG: lysophospholipid acyltransferase family protein [Bacteroidales bacterium]|nr:lysophospholipid acyltransferase family protein [Bacteroidales bacterium]